MFLYKERDETFIVSQIRKSVYYPTNVDNLIRLIVCSISLLTCFMQRQDSDIRANDNVLFPAIAGRAGSYGVQLVFEINGLQPTTRIEPKLIQSRSSQRVEKRNGRGGEWMGRRQKKRYTTYPDGIVDCENVEKGQQKVSLIVQLMRENENNVVIISSGEVVFYNANSLRF